MKRTKQKVLVAYWSSRNLGVLDNIINSLMVAGFEIKEMPFNYLQNLPINKYLNIKTNQNILNILYLLILGLKLNFKILFRKRIYLFGTNLPLFCPLMVKKKRLVCHYNEVPKFFENSDSILPKYERAIFNNVSNIIVSNTFRRELFETVNKDANYFILDNILSYKYYTQKDFFFRKVGIPVKLLYSGIISNNREIINIIKAVKTNSKFELTLIGEVDNSCVKLFFDEIEDADNIKYLGKVSFEKALSLTEATDFGIAIYNLVDRNNFFCAPVKIHEYFHFRKPVISLENPPLVKIAQEFQIIFPLKKIDELQFEETAEKLKNTILDSNNFINFEGRSLSDFCVSINNLITTVIK